MTAFITCPGKLETDEACRSAAPGVHLPVGVASENASTRVASSLRVTKLSRASQSYSSSGMQ